MKRLLLPIAFAIITGGAASASNVIDCSGDKNAVNSCMTSNLPNFTTQLDWAALGQPVEGDIFAGMWTKNSVMPGMDVSVGSAGGGVLEGVRLAYNFGSVYFDGQWTLANSLPNNLRPYSFPGHFNAATDPLDTNPGDHLVGLALNGSTAAGKSLLLNFDTLGFDNLGFRVAANTLSDFGLRVQVFTGLNGAGTSLSDSNFNFTGGGQCSGLYAQGVLPPVPCNDAPMVNLLNYEGQARSLLISSSDANGFYLGNLYLGNFPESQSEVPEPATIVLSGCGIALLLAGRRRLQKKA